MSKPVQVCPACQFVRRKKKETPKKIFIGHMLVHTVWYFIYTARKIDIFQRTEEL